MVRPFFVALDFSSMVGEFLTPFFVSLGFVFVVLQIPNIQFLGVFESLHKALVSKTF